MSRIARCLVALAVVVVIVVGWPAPVPAHTGFEASDPADGAVVDQPVDEVTLRFSGPAQQAGDGFVVFEPGRGRRQPTAVRTTSEGTFALRFEPPLSGGQIGVRWSVQAPDAHPISGSFRFAVDTPTSASAPDAEPGGPAAEGGGSIDAFLAADRTSPAGRLLSDGARFFAMGATLVAVGFLVFSLTVMRGTRRELRMLLFWVRRAGVVVAVATLLDALGQVVERGGGIDALVDPGAHADVLAGSAGIALVARFIGGAVVATRADLVMVRARHTRDVLRSVSAAVPLGAGSVRVADQDPDEWHARDLAWEMDRRGRVAVAGVVAVLASHVFDGHTVTEGNRWLTGLASSVHVLAAAVWAGGVLALALVIRRRWRSGAPTHALVMVVRYSIVATVALAVVAVAGAYLAVVILDGPSELWTTEWGRYFLVKLALVAAAAALGAHNHHVIVPALERHAEDRSTIGRLRSTLVKEVAVLGGVTVVTAVLVRAAATV